MKPAFNNFRLNGTLALLIVLSLVQCRDEKAQQEPVDCAQENSVFIAAKCKKPTTRLLCGNNFIDGDETCDDGNLQDGDGCSAQCENTCQNGVVEPPYEACDGNPGCGSDCLWDPPSSFIGYKCGDGVVNPGETCDDGNQKSKDGCSSQCQTEVSNPTCGDNHLSLEVGEQCDDGNQLDGDGCESDCHTTCGDGKLDIPYEMCDGQPGCGPDCLWDSPHQFSPLCGDGVVNPGEQCDDSNLVSGDQCSPICFFEEISAIVSD